VDVLKTRALQFLELARHALERGFPELVLFNVEQFAQLYVKYLIYRRAGDFPKTHYLRDLFDRLLDVYGDVCGLGDFIKRWKRFMAVLEVAYTVARYLLYRARREDVDDAMAFVEEALGVFKCLES